MGARWYTDRCTLLDAPTVAGRCSITYTCVCTGPYVGSPPHPQQHSAAPCTCEHMCTLKSLTLCTPNKTLCVYTSILTCNCLSCGCACVRTCTLAIHPCCLAPSQSCRVSCSTGMCTMSAMPRTAEHSTACASCHSRTAPSDCRYECQRAQHDRRMLWQHPAKAHMALMVPVRDHSMGWLLSPCH